MSEEIKPIKRSKELAPLSREHHEGLLLGWKIKQGLKNGTDHSLIAQYIQWFWEAELQEHFRKEEEVLAIHLPADNEWLVKMQEEHDDIRARIYLIAQITDEDLFIQLAKAIQEHIRFEERTLFPFAEKVIPLAEMEAIYAELIKTKEKDKWEQEFWLKK